MLRGCNGRLSGPIEVASGVIVGGDYRQGIIGGCCEDCDSSVITDCNTAALASCSLVHRVLKTSQKHHSQIRIAANKFHNQ